MKKYSTRTYIVMLTGHFIEGREILLAASLTLESTVRAIAKRT